MTKEERAEKWFRNIPNAEAIDLETRMEKCSNVAKKMILVFFAAFVTIQRYPIYTVHINLSNLK